MDAILDSVSCGQTPIHIGNYFNQVWFHSTGSVRWKVTSRRQRRKGEKRYENVSNRFLQLFLFCSRQRISIMIILILSLILVLVTRWSSSLLSSSLSSSSSSSSSSCILGFIALETYSWFNSTVAVMMTMMMMIIKLHFASFVGISGYRINSLGHSAIFHSFLCQWFFIGFTGMLYLVNKLFEVTQWYDLQVLTWCF